MLKKHFYIILIVSMSFFSAPPAFSQGASASVQVGPGQAVGSKTTETTTRTQKIGPDGEKIENEARTSESQRNSAKYEYSNLPGKWISGKGGAGAQQSLNKDTGPNPRYVLDRLPPGTNSDEALWVKMKDGRLMMVDPRETQRLKK